MGLIPQEPAKQKKLALILVPVAAAVLYWNFMYTPVVEDLDNLEARVERITAGNNAMRAVIARHGTDLPRRLAIFQEHVRQLEDLIPRREDVPVLIHQITQRALDTGVELTVIRPGSEVVGEFYSQQTFELQVRGNYHNIAEYLTAIGSLTRIVRPYDVKLDVEDRVADAPPTLRASFRIQTYVMPAPNSIEAPNVTT
jgi:type IV pilus assembly protein PilO